MSQYEDMEVHQQPEILREEITHCILQLKCLGIEDVMNFDYMDKPPRSHLVASVKGLYLLGAIG